jgi:hypothetical protein
VVVQPGVGRGANNSLPLKQALIRVPLTWIGTLVRPKQCERDLRFGAWNVGRMYRSGSLATVTRELARYKLDLVSVQEVRWDKGGSVRAGDYIFSVEKKMEIINW